MALKQIEFWNEDRSRHIDTWTLQSNHQVYVGSVITINGEKYEVLKKDWDLYDRELRIVRRV
jgi:hypothetical protein